VQARAEKTQPWEAAEMMQKNTKGKKERFSPQLSMDGRHTQ
jgi:hypothetical protein